MNRNGLRTRSQARERIESDMDENPDTLSVLGGAFSVFAPISPPILQSVDPVKVDLYQKAGEIYERAVASKHLELPSLTPLSYKARIDRGLLQKLIIMGELKDASPSRGMEAFTDERVKTFIESIIGKVEVLY